MSTLVEPEYKPETAMSDGLAGQHFNTHGVIWTLTGRAAAEGPVTTVDVTAGRFRIGRHNENHLCIPNDTVSGQHAELLSVNEQLFLTDLKSTNGTRVNGIRVTAPVPVKDGDILHFGSSMYTLATTCDDKSTSTLVSDTEGDAIAQVLFKRLLTDSGITPYFQPIVRFRDAHVIGYEALARSQFIGLETPDKMFRVAAEQSSELELAHECRRAAVQAMAATQPRNTLQCYLNTHPSELDPQALTQSLQVLREKHPSQKLTLEIHESAVTSLDYLKRLREQLTTLDIQLAYDDFGSGQTRLMELVEVPPDVVKFDVKFVRGLPFASQQRIETTRSIINMVKELGAITLAEGVETAEESELCQDCGFDLAQGYLFGRPAPAHGLHGN